MGAIGENPKAISIHASRVGGDAEMRSSADHDFISIHASRVGGDVIVIEGSGCVGAISIHASRVGGDCKNL